MRRYLLTLMLSVVLGGAIAIAVHASGAATQTAAPAPASRCPQNGVWREPGRTRDVPETSALKALGGADVVLLGELHATASHHAWHAQTVAKLAASGRAMVIGIEALPREAQGALDRWVEGEIDEARFLEEAGWSQHWGFPFALYRPVFALARAQRIPMIALNVERRWTRSVLRQGLETASALPGFPVGRPADPPIAYVDSLADHFSGHGGGAGDLKVADFVAAQLVWDRAMAEGIARARSERPGVQVVALMGLGHVENGWGVPHQLRALGLSSIASAVPVDAGSDCAAVGRGYSDLIIGLSPGNGLK